jgi:hypothetical protein
MKKMLTIVVSFIILIGALGANLGTSFADCDQPEKILLGESTGNILQATVPAGYRLEQIIISLYGDYEMEFAVDYIRLTTSNGVIQDSFLWDNEAVFSGLDILAGESVEFSIQTYAALGKTGRIGLKVIGEDLKLLEESTGNYFQPNEHLVYGELVDLVTTSDGGGNDDGEDGASGGGYFGVGLPNSSPSGTRIPSLDDEVIVNDFEAGSNNRTLTQVGYSPQKVSFDIGATAYLYDGSTLIATGTTNTNSQVSFENLWIEILKGTTKTLSLRVDTTNAVPGDELIMALTSFTYMGDDGNPVVVDNFWMEGNTLQY